MSASQTGIMKGSAASDIGCSWAVDQIEKDKFQDLCVRYFSRKETHDEKTL